ncbi:aminoacyl-histidine dipeptidase [Pseudoalteromonas denitrificans]|uniref:Cytosol non-specific dipeptidase n=1 Tax=Pseudoalteromonas denitrificans DSM 6059 TaxID=1123010 RepID=A0A1I1EWX9_9GAMM|nr:aminoacyl-histidine dipeptidase [Pseudoalteromonas denitrificans]SFB91226.1 Xaa-His dipeptidase . Metallo peptidase. MEROPS family M20C [Pseudoalteromonas denitrificans DSM 6059]
MSQLSNLSPQPLWSIFEKICSIPHPSKHEDKISAWIQQWVLELGLNIKEDKVGNLIIKKPATPGMENKKGVILQAHMDMVPQKNSDKEHNFVTDPIEPYIDGDWVTANGTTLGADNGIGLSASLAVLASKDIKHGPLEVLVTIDEEAGMTGAFGLEAGWLEGDILLNTDSEDEGEVYMGCAGGIDVNIKLPLETEPVGENVQSYSLSIKGLKGGHSGVDIHLGRGNANKILTRFLKLHQQELNISLSQFNGGSLRNAIPREASMELNVHHENSISLGQAVDAFQALLNTELSAVEPNLQLSLNKIGLANAQFSKATQFAFVNSVNACVNGVIRMSDEVEGVVETSTNLGVITTQDKHLHIQCLVRSLIDSARANTQNMISSTFELAGAAIECTGAYPGWEPRTDSPIKDLLRETYQKMFGTLPNIMVIHAGLECGLFKDAYPNWDMVSFGPTIRFPHSPDEKVKIDTVAPFYQLLLQVLENIPNK